jgi:hypothetical protein
MTPSGWWGTKKPPSRKGRELSSPVVPPSLAGSSQPSHSDAGAATTRPVSGAPVTLGVRSGLLDQTFTRQLGSELCAIVRAGLAVYDPASLSASNPERTVRLSGARRMPDAYFLRRSLSVCGSRVLSRKVRCLSNGSRDPGEGKAPLARAGTFAGQVGPAICPPAATR